MYDKPSVASVSEKHISSFNGRTDERAMAYGASTAAQGMLSCDKIDNRGEILHSVKRSI